MDGPRVRTAGARAPGSPPFSFELRATDGAARVGLWHTPHGDVPTPAFMPVGTAGSVKGVLPDQLRAAGSTQILANTYHLALRPGADVVADLGGLHAVMAWDGPILTDSGGFQVFSLADLATLTEGGVRFVSHVDGAKLELTPESSVEVQAKLGADVAMCLDECPPLPCPPEKMRDAVDRTTRWAARCRDRWDSLDRRTAGGDPQALFGIVQGGTDPAMRARSAAGLLPLDFPGYAIGGLSVGEAPAEMYATLDAVAPPAARGQAPLPDGRGDAGGPAERRAAGGGPVRLRDADPQRPQRQRVHVVGTAENQERRPHPGPGPRSTPRATARHAGRIPGARCGTCSSPGRCSPRSC